MRGGRAALRRAGAALTPSQRKLIAQGMRFAFGAPEESDTAIPSRTDAKTISDRKAAKQIVNGLTQGWEWDKGGGWR